MSRVFRIAMVAACPFPAPRGTPVRIYRMAEALAGRGHEVHVVTYHLGTIPKDLPFQVHRIPPLRSYQKLDPGPTYQKLALVDTLLARKLASVLHRHDIDLVHAHHYEGILVSSLVQPWRRHLAVYDAHTLLESELPHYPIGLPQPLLRHVGRLLDRSLPQRANAVVAISEAIKWHMVEQLAIAPERVTLVPNGVEWEHFALPAAPVRAAHAAKTLVFSGNTAPYQGIDLLLKSFRAVLDARPDTRLRIVSEGAITPYLPLIEVLGLSGQIDLVRCGFADLPQYLASADVALNPRVACDGVPLKLLNYMAACKPIVSFAGSAKPLEHEQTGLLVHDGDTAAFAAAVLRLLADPALAERLGANARHQVQAAPSWEQMAKRVEATYEQLWEEQRLEAQVMGWQRKPA